MGHDSFPFDPQALRSEAARMKEKAPKPIFAMGCMKGGRPLLRGRLAKT